MDQQPPDWCGMLKLAEFLVLDCQLLCLSILIVQSSRLQLVEEHLKHRDRR